MSRIVTIAAPVRGPETHPQEGTGEMRYIARQPILDENHRVHGYELLLEMNLEPEKGRNDAQATRTILDDAVIFGIDRLTNGMPAFVRCTAEALQEQLVSVLPPEMTVLEAPASLEVTAKLVDACRELKAAGFRLALLDSTWSPEPHPLFELADYIRVDLSTHDAAGWKCLRQKVHGTSTVLVANQVETQADYREACTAGFALFQGYYFCRPELIRNAKVPANRLFHFDILRQLNQSPLDLRKLSPLVLRDAALTYRLLRLVNSPLYAVRQEVRSIESAILLLGERTFRRITTLAIFSELNAQEPPEILHMALVRARFCEQAAEHARLDPNEQYLLGMFSLLPAMMRQPMETLAGDLPLRPEIREALVGTDNADRCLLAWIEAHERNDQAARETIADARGLNQQRLIQYYLGALLWDAAARGSAA